MMHAMASLKENPSRRLVKCGWPPQSMRNTSFEACSRSARACADAAIVAEPTEFRAIIASKGVLRWKVRVQRQGCP